ncbi:unnamed protein product [Blepharisma stoltei]|uniref:DUF7646 domain-containing protein n=1 Tax=Blepharisma stoltei TaxID=1481888 RepID=A0AAU9JWE3_9CILI|nr:unnamed protein product [Blepharisma stoltei]
MEECENRPKAEKYFPQGNATLIGAQAKMQFLRENAGIAVGIPLRHQIYTTLQSADQGGLTVQEVSKKLCLNTKTCAKVLDEMVSKHEDIKATAHRYGRVFVHKYHIYHKEEQTQEALREDEEYITQVNPEILEEIKKAEVEHGKAILDAIEVNLKAEKRPTNRQRVTHQTFIRALFVVSRIQTLKVSSIYEMKEMIKTELEPNAKWCLDKKTVLRIVWKLQSVGLIRQMCFKITLKRNDENAVEYLGDEYESIERSKKTIKLNGTTDAKGNTVLYKVIISLPGIHENDPLVVAYPLLQNPTNRKPIATPGHKLPSPIPLHSKYLKKLYFEEIASLKKLKENGDISLENLNETVNYLYKYNLVDIGNEGEKEGELEKKEEIIKTEETDAEDEEISPEERKAVKLSVFIKWAEYFHQRVTKHYYETFFETTRVSSAYFALKMIYNEKKKDPAPHENKLNLAYTSINLPSMNVEYYDKIPENLWVKNECTKNHQKSHQKPESKAKNKEKEMRIHESNQKFEVQLSEMRQKISELGFLKHCRLPKKRKGGVLDAAATIKKVFLTLENKPLIFATEQISALTKRLDVEPPCFISFLEILGAISENFGRYKVNPPWAWGILYRFTIIKILISLSEIL